MALPAKNIIDLTMSSGMFVFQWRFNLRDAAGDDVTPLPLTVPGPRRGAGQRCIVGHFAMEPCDVQARVRPLSRSHLFVSSLKRSSLLLLVNDSAASDRTLARPTLPCLGWVSQRSASTSVA